MGVRLTEEERDEFLTNGHTLIMATIRKSGEPLLIPIWYVWMDGAFWTSTGAKSPKVQHLRRDPRVCCMVEEGEKWIDLRAVIANCDAEFVTDPALIEKFNKVRGAKYKAFGREGLAVPEATQKHYAREGVIIRMTPRPGEIRSWYNRKIRMTAA